MMGAYNRAARMSLTASTFRSSRAEDTYHDTEDTVGGCDQGIACAPILRREELRRDGVKDAVHDVVDEGVATVPAKEYV